MPEPVKQPVPPVDRDTWLRTLYQLAHANINWDKEQGWRVVGWSLALLGGLIAIYRSPLSKSHVWPFAVLVAVLVIVAIWYLARLNKAAQLARATAVRIESTLPHEILPLGERSTAGAQRIFLILQVLLLVVAGILTVIALVRIHGIAIARVAV
jgi:hypothetical protein